jgi:hypothetical protein
MAPSGAAQYNRTRASLVASDALMTALGRPNREQIHHHAPDCCDYFAGPRADEWTDAG